MVFASLQLLRLSINIYGVFKTITEDNFCLIKLVM